VRSTTCLQRPGAVLTERRRRTTETVLDAHDHIEQVGRCCTLLLQSSRSADAHVGARFPSPRTEVPDCPPVVDAVVEVERRRVANEDERWQLRLELRLASAHLAGPRTHVLRGASRARAPVPSMLCA
jgi:hypothetical protein